MLAAGQWLQSRYRIIRPLGQGGMGQVYLAADSRLGDQPVAVKTIVVDALSTAELGERWKLAQQEAHLLARLNHSGIARVLDCFAEGDAACIVMEYVAGETLAERLAREPDRRLPPEMALTLTRTLCDVLAYLHARQPAVIFRDLKPANVMLTPGGEVKLIDFGIARFFKPGQTRDTAAFGTTGYAAPEQYGAEQTVPQSDIYSLGVLLHEMLTGDDPTQRTPFLALTPPSRMGIAVSPSVDLAIARATNLAVANRFVSADSFAAALDAPLHPPKGKLPLRWIVGGLLAGGLLIGGVWAAGAWRRQAPATVESIVPTAETATNTPMVRSVVLTLEPTSEPELTVAPTKTLALVPTPTPIASRLELSGDGLVQLTSGEADEYAPSYSPDQREMVYMTNADGSWQIVAQDEETRGTRPLTDNGANNFIPSYSPDGTQVLFASNISGDFDLYLIESNGGEMTQLLDRPGDDVNPSFSPDGSRVLFMSDSGQGWGIYVLDLNDGNVEVVIDTGANETFPAWLPDSRSILFQSDASSSHDIYMLSLDDGQQRQLTFDSARDAAPMASPDGNWVVFESSRDGNYNIYGVSLTGEGERQLTDHVADDQVPRFSPDGKWLLFQSQRSGNWDLFRQPFPPN